MDTNTIASVTQIAIQNGIGLGLISLLSVGVLIWMRTRSTHMLLARLWRLFNGKAECSVPLIKDFLSSHSAVLQFRFMTGLPVRTLQQVESLCSWTAKNNEDIGDVSACGKYFDLERPGLKPMDQLPRRWQLFALLAIAVLLGMGFFLALGGTISDRALLRFNASETWFTLDTISAIPLADGAGFKLAQCTAIDTIMKGNPGFHRSDVRSICESFTAGQVGPYVDSTVKSQRVAAAIASAYFLFFFLGAAGWFWRGAKANEMRRRLASLANKEAFDNDPVQ